MKIDPLRLPQAGQWNQNRSPPKLHFVVVSKTVRLTLGELAFSWSRYEIVISLPVSWMVTELTSFPLQSQVQIALAPCYIEMTFVCQWGEFRNATGTLGPRRGNP
jgi:hypothetical protein